jgi:hypothetical protein
MSVSAPFAPSGNTVVITASTTAPARVQVPSTTLGKSCLHIQQMESNTNLTLQ